jgi:cell wall-associated NlpC family hydrolase
VTDRRKHIARVLATLTLAALGGTVLVAAPSTAEPDVDTVQARVDHLYHQAEQASERYNTAREDLRHAKVRLAAVRADVSRQQTRIRDLRRQVAAAVVSRYQGQELSTTRVFLSDDPDAFLEQLTTVSQYADQQSQMMADFAAQAKQLSMRQEQAKRALAEVTGTVQQMAKDKAEIDRRAAQAKELLGKLKSEAAAKAAAAARTQAPSRDTTRPATPAPSAPTAAAPVSGRAGAAVDYALAQVGDAYVWGATGPSAFDCSGLTMMAWQQAGVSLPHSSSAQSSSGTRVASSDLQPGDLVFYYSPISHVGMYIGNGKIVHAANPSSGVEISPVCSMPYSGAVRPG